MAPRSRYCVRLSLDLPRHGELAQAPPRELKRGPINPRVATPSEADWAPCSTAGDAVVKISVSMVSQDSLHEAPAVSHSLYTIMTKEHSQNHSYEH